MRGRGGACGNPWGRLLKVEIEVSDPTLVDDLIESLRAAQFIVARTGAKTMDARFGWPLREDAARLELDLVSPRLVCKELGSSRDSRGLRSREVESRAVRRPGTLDSTSLLV